MSTVSVSYSIRTPWDTSDFSDIVDHILGRRYILSVVLIGDKKARTLNKAHRKKDTPANILSFPLTDIEGEIYINLPKAIREAGNFGFTPAQHVRYLLIHGCLHLKGYTHGGTMEEAEDALVERFVLC